LAEPTEEFTGDFMLLLRKVVTLAFVVFSASVSLPAFAVELQGIVVDSATGERVACRLYIQSADGQWSHARSTDSAGTAVEYNVKRGQNSIEIHTTLTAHPFVADLEPGEYTLTVERGKEYVPHIQQVTVGNAVKSIRIELKRWTNLAERGWFSGDTHVHRTLKDLPTAMLADDLNVALPLTYWVTKSHKAPTIGNKIDKDVEPEDIPKAELIEVDKTHVIWPINTEYEIFDVGEKKHTLGAVFVLNQKKPFEIGIPRVDAVAKEARRQHALLDLDKHSWPWSLMVVPQMQVDLFELTNNHVWRTEFMFANWTIDAAPDSMRLDRSEFGFTERGWVDFGLKTYYGLLNCGFKLRPSAGTASGVHPVGLGFGRVYVHLPNGFSYDNWIQGLNAGRSFVTTGPMLLTKFNEQDPGHQFEGEQLCKVTGIVESLTSDVRIEVIVNGDVLESRTPEMDAKPNGGFFAPISIEVPITGTSWVAVRCFETRGNERFRFAHTAPVHFDVPGKPLRPRKLEVNYFIQRMQEEITRNKDVLSDGELEEYRAALATYKEIAESAR
jgi:hypothetical protein